LKDNEDPVTQGLRAPFECFLDESEDLQKRSFSPLHLIVFGLSKVDLTSYLELDTEYIDSCCSLGRTPLAWAAYRRDPEPVKYLIKFGAAIDISDWRGQSAFSLAAETGHFKSMRILLRTAVRLEDRTSRLDPELVERLFNDENDQDNIAIANVGTFCRDMIEARDYKGRSALQFATRTNQLAHASILLRYGADVDSPDAFYRTPLHIAIYWNHHDVMRLLLESGASHHAVDANRLTLLHYAAKFADLTTLGILRKARIRGISPECRDSEGYTPSEIFDRLRPGILAEDSDTYAKSREEFETILAMSSVCEVEESDTASIDRWFDAVSSLEGSLASLLPLVDEPEQV
jgi:ankyrin repeat protein